MFYASIFIAPIGGIHVQVGTDESITIHTGTATSTLHSISSVFQHCNLDYYSLTLLVRKLQRLLSQHRGLLSLSSLQFYLSVSPL